ncbi:MAG: hypothetical protein ACMUJM_12660 [bacterium]
MSIDKEKEKEFIESLRKESEDNRITCSAAMRIADEYQFPRDKMAKFLTDIKIKLKKCQLGCF